MDEIESSSPSPSKRRMIEDDDPRAKLLNLRGNQFVAPPPQTFLQPPPPTDLGGTQDSMAENTLGGAAIPPPPKRRKLTTEEQAERARAKEEKEKERADRKAAKEAEKRTRDEEREAKKREKALEEQRKQEAKLKKERSQLKLGAFFTAAPGDKKETESQPAIPLPERPRSPTAGSGPGTEETEYHKFFLPFETPPHTTVHVPEYIIHDQDEYEKQLVRFGEMLKSGGSPPLSSDLFPFQERGIPQPNIRSVVEILQGTSSAPVDLTSNESPSEFALAALRIVSTRYIHFTDHVRPPYYGTYTKIPTCASLARNPFKRDRPDKDYDYDSEAEWQEGVDDGSEGGGEDLLSEEEEEDPEDDGNLEGFLDDSEDRPRVKTGPPRAKTDLDISLAPISTGICWETSTTAVADELKGMGLAFLVPGISSIDPFDTKYWAKGMDPPPPVVRTPYIGIAPGLGPSTPIVGLPIPQAVGLPPLIKPLEGNDLDEFKLAVIGSKLKRAALVRDVKQRYLIANLRGWFN
ncbi:hypothetical protein K470DRAFT_265001 [Piedraia hortae CBS 480.64]|uniref:Chromatin assembly factor 1 subunit A dimerization domain-containing protein n=1 Tax=Piedraia hortae CBS 480.64 TaxID=1314780 RepID=A0A6A7BYD3_9PEZI|nr:hypothetical protein K470DRAFT_265001 [Piedraia hortae CBS 480.64]